MLPLDSPRWAELKHAYGKAIDTPSLLQQLYEVPTTEEIPDELSEKIWSSLCHQGDTLTASYAAIPHIVTITSQRPPEHRISHLCLVAAIEQGRHLERAHTLPVTLADTYFAALKQTEELALQCLSIAWDERDYRYLLSVLSTVRGHIGLAKMLWLTDETTECPECDALFATQGYEDFVNKENLSGGTKLFQADRSVDYVNWLKANPTGFVLLPSKDSNLYSGVIHRVECVSLKDIDREEVDGASPRLWRVCGTDWYKLADWLQKHAYDPWCATYICEKCLPRPS